jgi:hypothetical protein
VILICEHLPLHATKDPRPAPPRVLPDSGRSPSRKAILPAIVRAKLPPLGGGGGYRRPLHPVMSLHPRLPRVGIGDRPHFAAGRHVRLGYQN